MQLPNFSFCCWFKRHCQLVWRKWINSASTLPLSPPPFPRSPSRPTFLKNERNRNLTLPSRGGKKTFLFRNWGWARGWGRFCYMHGSAKLIIYTPSRYFCALDTQSASRQVSSFRDRGFSVHGSVHTVWLMSEAGVFSLHALGFCDQLTCLPSLEADVFFLVGGCCAKVCRNRRGGGREEAENKSPISWR